MKKILLTTLVILGFFLWSGAQILEFSHNGEPFASGSTITIAGDPDEFELVSHMTVKNISSSEVTVKCRKIEIENIENTSNYYCWGACYPPFIYLSVLDVTIPAGESTDEFSGHYQPSGYAGIQQMCYSFFDINNPNDSIYYYVDFFASGVGIGEPAENESFVSHPYPNPAKSQVTFDYNFPAGTSSAVINIHNLLGERVREINLSGAAGKVVVGVDDLNDGIYFYSVNINNEIVETKRLVISK